MHRKFINFVKYNKFFVVIYRLLGNTIIQLLKFFVKIDDKKILFMSYGGRKFDDSPKALFEKILEDDYFSSYSFIWGLINTDKHDIKKAKVVKVDTLSFYLAALSSRIWVTNSSMERGLNLRRPNTIEINTWHGTPLKKIGNDMHKAPANYRARHKKNKSIYCAQSRYDQEIFARLFNTSSDNIFISDLPRNDYLTNYSQNDVQTIKQKIGISNDKKVILYAPTFREYTRNSLNSCVFYPPINLEKWQEKLGKDYVLLFRAHYEIIDQLNCDNYDFVINVTDWPNLNDLIIISDMLISDYSSIYFDYSITHKPMLNFSYDYETYSKERGLYLDLEKELPCQINRTEEELINEIINMNDEIYIQKTIEFQKKYAPAAGTASLTVINKLKNMVGEQNL